MYLAENAIRSAIRQDTDPLNILVVNDSSFDYVERMASYMTNHKFFMVQSVDNKQPQWERDIIYDNLRYYNNFGEIDEMYFDLIICFNRLDAFTIASKISRLHHVPLINVDFASSHTRYPVPFGGSLMTQDSLINNRGLISVGSTEFITDSWRDDDSIYKSSFTIGLPHRTFNKNPNAHKILLDKGLPEDFYRSLSIELDANLFTSDINEAAVYCHFLSNPNCLLLDCMMSEIPVLTFDSPDINEYSQKKLLLLMNEPEQMVKPNFVPEVQGFAQKNNLTTLAKEYIKENNKQADFKNKWDNIFKYCASTFYQRGI